MTRLIPPVLFLLLLLCLMPLSLLHPDSLVMRADAAMPWDIPIALGLTALFWGSWHFKRKKAEIHTFRQPQDLITDGRSATAATRCTWAFSCCSWEPPSTSTPGARLLRRWLFF